MSLDFAILGADGRPAKTLAIFPEDHNAIIDVAKRLNLRVTLRFEDYYADADVNVNEMLSFIDELQKVASELGLPETTLKAVSDLMALCRVAFDEGKGISGIAD